MTTGSVPTTNESQVVNELVAQQYMRNKVWENTKEINPVLERMKKAGTIREDFTSTYCELKARVGEYQKTQRADLEDRDFARKQHYVTYRFPGSWHEVDAMLSERDIALLDSPDAIYQRQKVELTNMGKDFQNDINSDILRKNAGSNSTAGIDADSGDDVPLYGLLTMFDPGSTVTTWNPESTATATTTTAKAATKEILPQGTYGGISTDPSSSISGVDDKLQDATSPVILHSDSTGWTGTGTWTSACTTALSYMILRLTRGNGMDERPDLAIFTRDDYLTLKTKLRSETDQQVVIVDSPKSPDAGMYPRLYLDYEGVTCLFDVDTPTDTFFCLNTNHLYLSTKKLSSGNFLGSKGPMGGSAGNMFMIDMDKDINQGAWKCVAQMYGQLYANPFYQGMGYKGF